MELPSKDEMVAEVMAAGIRPGEPWRDALERLRELRGSVRPRWELPGGISLMSKPQITAWDAFCHALWAAEKQVWAAKRAQENPRFHAGDLLAEPGGEYGRSVTIQLNAECVLCEEQAPCCAFKDNEDYGLEQLCARCLRAMLTALERRERAE